MSAPIPVFGDRPKAAPTPKLRALVSFPVNVEATTGIKVDKLSGTYTFQTNWNDFGSISAIPTAPTSYILTFDTATQAYVLVPSHLLGGAVAGIADAPNDGTQYGRQSGAWTAITGGGFADAPSNGTQYGRQNGAWTAVVSAAPATVAPLIDGTATVGTSVKYAREDHKHPTDTTRLADAPSDGTFYGRKNAAWTALSGIGTGDMLKSTYDPTAKNGDAFDSFNESFVQSGTGAVTRRSRDKMRDWVSVKDFGAAGDGTDDTDAIKKAMAAANSVYFPPGDYKTTSALTVAAKSIQLRGAGQGNTRILVAHNSGGIGLNINSASPINIMVEISDLDIVNVSGGTSGSAIAIFGTTDVQPAFSGESQCLIENVRVYSSTYDASVEKWTYGIYLQNVCEPRIINFCGWQIGANTGYGIRIANSNFSDNSVSMYGTLIENPVLLGWLDCIYITGAIEGVFIRPQEIVGCARTCIHIDGSGGPPPGKSNVIHIYGGDMASQGRVIDINNCRNVVINGCDIFRLQYSFGADPGQTDCIFIGGGGVVQVTGNKIGTAASMSGANMLYLNSMENVTVTGNNFYAEGVSAGGMGVSSSSKVMVSGNIFQVPSGPQAWYVVNSSQLNFNGNIDIGFGAQITETGNTNFDHTNNSHF